MVSDDRGDPWLASHADCLLGQMLRRYGRSIRPPGDDCSIGGFASSLSCRTRGPAIAVGSFTAEWRGAGAGANSKCCGWGSRCRWLWRDPTDCVMSSAPRAELSRATTPGPPAHREICADGCWDWVKRGLCRLCARAVGGNGEGPVAPGPGPGTGTGAADADPRPTPTRSEAERSGAERSGARRGARCRCRCRCRCRSGQVSQSSPPPPTLSRCHQRNGFQTSQTTFFRSIDRCVPVDLAKTGLTGATTPLFHVSKGV